MAGESYEAEPSANARKAGGAAARSLGRDWRARLVLKLGWVFVLKLAALTVIWYLWFAPSRAIPIDASATGTHFGLARGRLSTDSQIAVEQENLRD